MSMQKADLVLKGSAIFDGVSKGLREGGVAVAGNKILGVFNQNDIDYYIDSKTKVYECGHKLILSGLNDSHMHAGVGADFVDEDFCVDVSASTTFEECMRTIQVFGEKHPDNRLLFGSMLNIFNLKPQKNPTVRDIDAYISDRPVVILSYDIHTFYANSLAIKEAGFTKDTPDPNHAIGIFEDGELNGIFNDTAAFIMQTYVLNRPKAEKKAAMVHFFHKLNQHGITAISDMYPCGDPAPYPLFKELEDEGKLTVRVAIFPELLTFTKEKADEYKKEFHSDMLFFGGLKNLLDGVIAQHTAWMFEPYANDSSSCGSPSVPKEKMKEKLLEAHKYGINCRIHAIGDAAVHYALNCFEEARKLYGPIGKRDVMEHLDVIIPEDISKFAELNIVADIHPEHMMSYLTGSENMLETFLGKDRAKRTWLLRDILNTGGIIGTGSDYPVVSFDPMPTIHASVTRAEKDWPLGGFLPDQKLSLEEALSMFTLGSACAINKDKEIGTLEAGKFADITVLDKNLFTVDDHDWYGTKAVLTIVDGKVVYEA